jgi:GMP synthase (glutamine-hydrolysing)
MILITDNGSQYTHLIKRNCRDLEFEARIVQNKTFTFAEFEELIKSPDPSEKIEKIILSGGPSSVTAGSNGVSEEIVKWLWAEKSTALTIPLLGICFGHQLLAHALGGKVEKGKSAEYGIARISVDEEDTILKGVPKDFQAWVSHFDEVKKMPDGFVALAHSDTCAVEAMRHKTRNIFGVQFHPEVWHTEHGELILKNFLKV